MTDTKQLLPAFIQHTDLFVHRTCDTINNLLCILLLYLGPIRNGFSPFMALHLRMWPKSVCMEIGQHNAASEKGVNQKYSSIVILNTPLYDATLSL